MTVSIYSQSPSPLGTNVYRFTGVSAPAQFLPTLVFSAKQNASKTNVNVKVEAAYPLLVTVDGVQSAPNQFVGSFSFTALQNVQNDTERLRVIDELVAFVTTNRLEIASGSVLDITP